MNGLIKATFFLSVLSTENPEFPAVPLDPPQWKVVYEREMSVIACKDLVMRYWRLAGGVRLGR
jgi:hypothetical protein